MDYGSGAVLDPPPETFKHMAGNIMNALLVGQLAEEDAPSMFFYNKKPYDLDWLHDDKTWREGFAPLMRDTANAGFTVIGAMFIAHIAYYGNELTMGKAIEGIAEWISWWNKAVTSTTFDDLMRRKNMHHGQAAREFMKITNQILTSL